MTDRRKMAVYLFSEMNGIDEALLQEAIRPRVSARSIRAVSIRRVAILAAALTLAFAMLIGTALVALRSGERTEEDVAQTYVEDVGSADEAVTELSVVLARAEATDRISRLSEEHLDLFDGTLKLIWQHGGEGELCVYTVDTATAQQRMKRALNDRGDFVAENATEEETKVWVSMGDGRVVSPYLAISEGNVGYGCLFDYESEVEPTDVFVQTVMDLISDS